MFRRLFVVMVVAVGGYGGTADRARAASARRPNFVFFLIDDMRHDVMSCAGHPFVRTPNIDRIARGGVRFTNAFVTISLCAPSRACFLTGAYAHRNGVATNEGQGIRPDHPTFAQILQKAGYETAFIGKWHMEPTAEPRPGFDYWLSFRGQGEYIDPMLNENGRTFRASGYMTDLLTRYAVEWLARPRSKPFALCIWHKAMHGPFTPAERHKGLYADIRLPEPVSFRDTFEGKPRWQRELIVAGGQRRRPRRGADAAPSTAPAAVPDRVEPEKWDPTDERRINYLRTLAAVDEGVGRVLDALEKAAVADNTVVIFAGDNGFFLGEHRRGDKRLAYEESIRIPLLMSGPGVRPQGGTIPQVVLNIDVAPTILAMAGAEVPGTMQGCSLEPLFAGRTGNWRRSFLYEYYREQWLAGIPTMVGVRREDWKYVRYPERKDLDELYDLRHDLHEMRNLATDPAAGPKLAEMKAELDRLIRQTGYTPAPAGPPRDSGGSSR